MKELEYEILEDPKRIHFWNDAIEGLIQAGGEVVTYSIRRRGRGYRWNYQEKPRDGAGFSAILSSFLVWRSLMIQRLIPTEILDTF